MPETDSMSSSVMGSSRAMSEKSWFISSESRVSEAMGSTRSLRKCCSRSSACAWDSPTTVYAMGHMRTESGSRPPAAMRSFWSL